MLFECYSVDDQIVDICFKSGLYKSLPRCPVSMHFFEPKGIRQSWYFFWVYRTQSCDIYIYIMCKQSYIFWTRAILLEVPIMLLLSVKKITTFLVIDMKQITLNVTTYSIKNTVSVE